MHIQNEKIYMLIVEFGLNTPNPLRFPLYAPERVCKIVPQAGDESTPSSGFRAVSSTRSAAA